MSEILDEAFTLVGKDIVLAHAKDLDRDGDAGHLPAGQGKLDYGRYLSLLHTYGYHGPLLLHGLRRRSPAVRHSCDRSWSASARHLPESDRPACSLGPSGSGTKGDVPGLLLKDLASHRHACDRQLGM